MTDVSPLERAPTLWNYDLCGQYPGDVPVGATVYLSCACHLAAHRYLILHFPIYDGFNFCELEVFIRSECQLLSSSIKLDRPLICRELKYSSATVMWPAAIYN